MIEPKGGYGRGRRTVQCSICGDKLPTRRFFEHLKRFHYARYVEYLAGHGFTSEAHHYNITYWYRRPDDEA